MKTKFLILFSFILVFLSCKGNDGKTVNETDAKNQTAVKEDYSSYKEIHFNVKSDYKDNSKKNLEIFFADFLFKIQFVDDRAYLKASFKNKMIRDFQQVVYNFTYDSDYVNAEKRVKIIYNGKDGYLFLPGYSEEFQNFTVYKFNSQDFKFNQALSLNTHNCKDGEIFLDNKNEIFFMVDKTSKTKCIFSKEDAYPVSTKQAQKDLAQLQQNKNGGNALNEFVSDLNRDGKKDKISVYKNDTAKDDFDKTHFVLPLKILLSSKSGSIEKSNNNMVFSNNSNCISEGFSTVATKDNYFTIEQQTCYDYVLVDSYITFKVDGNEIYLHKYGETYFDKANHERKIPDKIWTVKDFGKVKFENVNENFLLRLRNK
ncbi:hypothetical protein [Chryseobacterium sp. GP-SGM7]|uniref:hypothetical protein n=1 Tax=Chryseobacterium sp. GP-SGM7 TaxID=3411323 RepID=UPI003B963769